MGREGISSDGSAPIGAQSVQVIPSLLQNAPKLKSRIAPQLSDLLGLLQPLESFLHLPQLAMG
jgi:hypothetical protein